jgi:hypothetical protein
LSPAQEKDAPVFTDQSERVTLYIAVLQELATVNRWTDFGNAWIV